jgi:hypothetical protein
MVPLRRLGLTGAAPALGAPAPTFAGGTLAGLGTGGGAAAGTPGRGPGTPAPWFIINIVPLNFGAALFIENPHLAQV